MTLVFREVRRPGSVKRPSTATPSRTISWVRRWPGLSSPTRPRTSTWAPRATRLLTTLPAPPRVRVSRSTSTTATGASGEMRSTLPQRYSSSIKSPATRTLRLENPSRSRLRRRSPSISALSGDSGDMASGSLRQFKIRYIVRERSLPFTDLFHWGRGYRWADLRLRPENS